MVSIEEKAERMRGRERVFRKQTESKEAAPKLWDEESRRLFNEERHVVTVKKDGVTVAAYRSDRYKPTKDVLEETSAFAFDQIEQTSAFAFDVVQGANGCQINQDH